MNATMARAYQILSTFNDEELKGFIMMFSKRTSEPLETDEESMAERKAAFERILAIRPHGSVVEDDKQEWLNYLDERYGTGL